MLRRLGVIAIVLGVTIAGFAIDAVTASAAKLPGTACRVFPADNVWNTRVNQLPVNAKSAQWLAAMSSSTTRLHPDYGPAGGGQPPYGMPWQIVSPSDPRVPVQFQYAAESDPGPYPLSASTPIEGGSDRHALMVDPSTCTLYELFNTHYKPSGQSTAGSGAIWTLGSNTLRPAGWTSADAAGLPILPGLVNYDEVAAGAINHAIRVTASCTSRSYLWPARHEAGDRSSCPPMGARFRLKSGYHLPSAACAAHCQTVVTAMKRYGLIVADNGSNWYFTGTSDVRWTGDDVNELKQIPASAFVALDESCLKVSAGSGRAYQPGTPEFTARCTP
ncbi:MAG TPA: hypothetical protein VGN59_14270 [Acidimicrobiia bacterium]